MTDDFAGTVRPHLSPQGTTQLGSGNSPSPRTAGCATNSPSEFWLSSVTETASAGFLRFHRKLDANGSAMIYGLSGQRDAFTKVCFFVRIDAIHLRTSWQLHEGGNLEHALGGWWNIPLLATEDQNAFLESKVIDLIWTLRATSTSHKSRF